MNVRLRDDLRQIVGIEEGDQGRLLPLVEVGMVLHVGVDDHAVHGVLVGLVVAALVLLVHHEAAVLGEVLNAVDRAAREVSPSVLLLVVHPLGQVVVHAELVEPSRLGPSAEDGAV